MLLELIQIDQLFKILQIILLSGIKFIFAPPLAFEFGFNYFQTILFTTAGGIAGVIFFFYVSRFAIILFKKYMRKLNKRINFMKFFPSYYKANKIFTKRNRKIVKIMNKYGLSWLILLTPVLFSIPIGTFIITRYYPSHKNTFLFLSISVLVWSFVMTTAYFFTLKRF